MILSDPYMRIKFLSPIDQEYLDPTGRVRAMLKRFNVSQQMFGPKSPLCKKNTNTQSIIQYADKLKNNSGKYAAHASYFHFNEEYIEKTGPQGGIFPIEVMEQTYVASYHNAHDAKEFNYSLFGVQWLADYIRHIIIDKDIDIMTYADDKRTLDTAAAIPTGGKKGTFYAETIAAKPWRHYLPNVPGERYMRRKCRTINQDACINVRYTENIMSAVRNFLKHNLPEFFGSWLNPHDVIQPTATQIVDRNMYSVETDYEHMDEHFSIEAATKLVLPIYEACLIRYPAEYWRIAQMVEEMFNQPLYFGNYMYTGLHCLFSGQLPTNDFETVAQVVQAIGCLLVMNKRPDQVLQLHIGDDMVVAFKNKADAQLFWNLFITESDLNGLKINKTKSVIRHGECQYCRKLYYARGKRYINEHGNYVLYGAYPTVLAMNSIINPEKPSKSLGINAVATYQRLDNAIGSPDFYELCQTVAKLLDLDVDITDDDIRNYSLTDWWSRLYGEPWDPMVSPSFKFLNNIKI